jgi:hypothetical protein
MATRKFLAVLSSSSDIAEQLRLAKKVFNSGGVFAKFLAVFSLHFLLALGGMTACFPATCKGPENKPFVGVEPFVCDHDFTFSLGPPARRAEDRWSWIYGVGLGK